MQKYRNAMSYKEAVLERMLALIPRHIILRHYKKIKFIAAVKDGLQEIDQGRGMSIKAVQLMIEG